MLNRSSHLATVLLLTSPFTIAPGYRRPLITGTGKISLAINWEDVTWMGVEHMPALHGILQKKNESKP